MDISFFADSAVKVIILVTTGGTKIRTRRWNGHLIDMGREGVGGNLSSSQCTLVLLATFPAMSQERVQSPNHLSAASIW